MDVAGPGSVERVGKGVVAHACSISALVIPAGKVGAFVFGFGTCNVFH